MSTQPIRRCPAVEEWMVPFTGSVDRKYWLSAYRFPIKTASKIAWETIVEYCRDHPKAFDEIRLVTFSDKDRKVYTEALESTI